MTQIQKYGWLIDTIREAGKISLRELSAKWKRSSLSEGEPLSRATFNRWVEGILTSFGIIISCQRTGGYLYYIENPEALSESELQKWMLASISTGNLLADNYVLKDRIIVEPAPMGVEYLTTILHAMRDNSVLCLSYRSFVKEKTSSFEVHPYGIKLFDRRWYLIAYCPSYEEIRTYALDRMEALEPVSEHFSMPKDFDLNKWFEGYSGITVDSNIAPEHIEIRVCSQHASYLKTLPLHSSQQLVEETDEYSVFKLNVAPTFDFIMELLKAGHMIEVLSPISLRKRMKDEVENMARLYAEE